MAYFNRTFDYLGVATFVTLSAAECPNSPPSPGVLPFMGSQGVRHS